jgi:ribosomal protein S8E
VASKKRKRRKKLSPEERQVQRSRRKHYADFRTFLNKLGFSRVKADGIEIVVDGRTGEIDDIFIYENVLILVEYTTGQPDSAHILKKKPLFDKIQADVPRFLKVARSKYDLGNLLSDIYDDGHPCQFPVALAQRIVRALCPKGGIIFDPYMGAGSAGVAAMVEERRFVGTEIKKKYFDLAVSRLNAAATGEAKFRPIERAIYEPDPRTEVARVPSHFFKIAS